MLRFLVFALAFSSCVTVGTERTRLISKEVVAEPCIDDELSGSAEPSAEQRVHLSISVKQHCAKVERETWAAETSSQLADLPRLVIAGAATLLLLGVTTAVLLYAADQSKSNGVSAAVPTVAYASILGVGAGLWLLLGAHAVSPAPNQSLDTALSTDRFTRPYAGPVRLGSGAVLQLDAHGADVDPAELSSGVVQIGDSAVPIDGLVKVRAGPARPDARFLP